MHGTADTRATRVAAVAARGRIAGAGTAAAAGTAATSATATPAAAKTLGYGEREREKSRGAAAEENLLQSGHDGNSRSLNRWMTLFLNMCFFTTVQDLTSTLSWKTCLLYSKVKKMGRWCRQSYKPRMAMTRYHSSYFPLGLR